MKYSPQAEIALFLKRLQWLVIAGAIFWLVSLLGAVLTPFVVSALLAWFGNPFANWLESKCRSRTLAVSIVFLLMGMMGLIVVLILIPMIEKQVITLINALPDYRDWFVQQALPWIEKRTNFSLKENADPEVLIAWIRSHWQQAGGAATVFFSYMSKSGIAVVAWAANIVLIPILSFYFLRDWNQFIQQINIMVPRKYSTTFIHLTHETSQVLSAFLRGQFSVMLALGAVYAVGLSMIGLNLGLLIGLVAGLISFVPYLGAITGVLFGVITALVQAKGIDVQLLVLMAIVFGIGQLLESYVFTPYLVGDRIGLHPAVVVFSVLAGGQLFGLLGMLIALPVAAVVNVLARFVYRQYLRSHLYSGDSPPEPPIHTQESEGL